MQEPIDLRKIAEDVEREYGLGGLSGGTLYEDFAVDVAKRALLMAAKLADEGNYGPVPHRIGDHIRERFGLEG